MIPATSKEQAAKRSTTPWWWLLAGAGGLSVIASFIIGTNRYAGTGPADRWTLSRVNGLCSSAAGQWGQVMNSQFGARCSSIASLEQWRGWLMVAGIIAIAGGAAWALILRSRGVAR